MAVLTLVTLLCMAAFAAPGAHAEGQRGLVRENGKIYYYNDDGTLFTGGYKAVEVNGKRQYYYFQSNGAAYTDGYLSFTQGGKRYYFYFQEDGTAFTGGYKEVILNGRVCYFYFLANGQGFNTGYKTVEIGGRKYYFYFGSDGKAVTNTVEAISMGDRTAYFLFQNDGKAFTGGYKELSNGGRTDYYYFLQNGQAYTTGYKTVSIGGTTYYFYFNNDGRAYTDGLKAITFGNDWFYYYFQSNGRALTNAWQSVGGTDYYMQSNGRAAKGWFEMNNGWYYTDANYKMVTNRVIDGYVIDASGRSETKARINRYVDQHTTASMTNQQKIEALYNWILGSDMTYIRTYEHTSASWVWKDSWVDDMASDLMDNWGGNCFRYAAFLGMCIREATGLPVIVYRGTTPGASVAQTPHGWVTVYQDGQWYSYDVELPKFSNYSKAQCYRIPYSQSSKTLYFSGVGVQLY